MNHMQQHLNYIDIFGEDEKKPKAVKGQFFGGRKAKPAPRIGATCKTCGVKTSLMGECYCGF